MTAPFLTRFTYLAPPDGDAPAPDFPFSLPLLRSLNAVELRAPVTFLAGENGSGKSTLLEALAVALRCIAIGSYDLSADPSLEPARQLSKRLRLRRRATPRLATFFRAEDAFGFTTRVRRERDELETIEEEFRDSFDDGSWGQQLAMGSARGQRLAFESRYGKDPDARSHGESFLHLLQERIAPKGLYILDEPETPLSPLRQLALLHLLQEKAREGCQFLVASHSPILMALPDAQIFWLEDEMQEISWSDLPHVTLTRSFLESPQRYLRHL